MTIFVRPVLTLCGLQDVKTQLLPGSLTTEVTLWPFFSLLLDFQTDACVLSFRLPDNLLVEVNQTFVLPL